MAREPQVAYERHQVHQLLRRLSGTGTSIQTIIGPRHAGKTTIAHQVLARLEQPSLYRAADNPHLDRRGAFGEPADAWLPGRRDLSWLLRTWQEARRMAVEGSGAILVLDEVQKVENWAQHVQALWKEDRQTTCPLQVVILGSGPMSVPAGSGDGFPGSGTSAWVETVSVSHWSFEEMADAFGLTLEEYIFHGGWPGAAHLVGHPAEWRRHVLSSLVETTLERDLLEGTSIEKPALLKRLVQLGCAESGQILSFERIQRELGDSGNIATLADYMQLLEQAGLLAGLPSVSRGPNLAAASRRKLVILNTALMTAASGCDFEQARADRTFWSHVVATSVGAHLMNTKDDRTSVLHWRHKHGAEVDFVLSRGPQKIAVAVKSGGNAGPAAHRRPEWALRKFKRRFRPQRTLLVAPTLAERGAIPLSEFLSRPASSWFEGGK